MKEKSCGCIVIEDGKVLLVKHNQGHWGFPKGHVEGNETEEETAKREVKEETNIDVEIIKGKRYTEEYITNKGNDKEVIYFIAKKISGEIKKQESEIENIEWVEIEEVENRLTYNNSKELFKKVLEEIK